MLSEKQRLELRSEAFTGNIFPMLNRLRLTRNPDYVPACEYVLAELCRFHEVPAGRHAGFYGDGTPLLGMTIAFGQYSDRNFLQEVGTDIRHPDPLPPEPAPEPDPSTPRTRSYFRPPRDVKMAQANDL
jgi:hypothetical protein